MKAVAFNECIHCGFCLEACPTYDVLGTELDSPRGRLYLMRALEEGSIAPTEPVVRHIDLCLGCRACETECPSGVPYGHHLEEARRTLRASPHRPGGERWIESLLLRAVAMPPGLQKPAATLLAALQRIGLFGLIARSPRMNAAREQADAATRSSRLRGGARLLASAKLSSRSLPTVTPARGERRRRVGFLEGCVNRWVFGHVNEAGARLLSRAGCEVVAPPGQRCCGALHLHAGDIDGARRLARKNIAAFEAAEVFGAGKVSAGGERGEESVGGGEGEEDGRGGAGEVDAGGEEAGDRASSRAATGAVGSRGKLAAGEGAHERAGETLDPHGPGDGRFARPSKEGGLDAIVVTAAGCGAAMKEYEILFRGDPEWEERAHRFASRVKDVLEFLAELGPLRPLRAVAGKIAYHDACHLAHAQGVRSQPRALLAEIPSLQLVPLAESDRCCGSAGIYNILHPEVAGPILERKLERARASGATILAAANPGCLLQIEAGAREAGLALRTAHPIELLDEACRD